ncbi:MAG: hypothetical protein NT032_07990, partial [Actinobacteria bacterium]|nr:hypothetical protein [Actinomycetota bacterium]
TDAKYESEEEVSFGDVLDFLKRQYVNILAIFFISFSAACIYVLSRPLLYESKADVVIGSMFFFANANAIEPLEQIKYIYSTKAQVTPIKNTMVVQVTARHEEKNLSQKFVEDTIEEIVGSHKNYLQAKKEEAVQLLRISSVSNKQDATDLIDRISASSSTKQIGKIVTTELPFSGLLKKGLGLGFAFSLFLALGGVVLMDSINRIKARTKSASTEVNP